MLWFPFFTMEFYKENTEKRPFPYNSFCKNYPFITWFTYSMVYSYGRQIQCYKETALYFYTSLLPYRPPYQGFFQQFWEKVPGQNWGKMIDLTSKLGEINDIEHNKGSKIYPQNQVILDCIMSSIPFEHKCLLKYHSDMGHCFS